MKEIKIYMKGISKIFETEKMSTHALRDINFQVVDGDFVSISGPSGCGKSTFLSVLGLLDLPTSGEYLLDGLNVFALTHSEAARTRNEKIGFVFQSFNLIDDLSVFENVALPFFYRKDRLSKEDEFRRVKECLDLVDMGHRSDHRPSELSGGQQQRVAIARALVASPAILLVDEPTGNLDVKSGDMVMELLTTLNRNGVTICMVTHDSRYVEYARTKYKMLDGVLEACS